MSRPQGMLGDVLAQPGQLADALWRVESAGIPAWAEPAAGLAVCGMGGSAIGGDLAAAIAGPRAARPLVTVRDYAPPPWVGPGWLALCASYSGETEETLSCFEAAGAAGAQRVALTTGGTLAAEARAAGVPVIGVPAGMQPRAAVVYMTVAALECAALCGAAPRLKEEVESAAEGLGKLAAEWGPDAGEGSQAKAIARALAGTVPVVYGAGPTAPVARRWKTQLNENAKRAAFFAELPEADHNEICGWEPAGEGAAASGAPLSAVLLEDPDQHPRTRRRFPPTAEIAARAAGPERALRVESRGDTPAERVLGLVLLGDLVSVYLAALEGTDPTPVEAIERFKQALQ